MAGPLTPALLTVGWSLAAAYITKVVLKMMAGIGLVYVTWQGSEYIFEQLVDEIYSRYTGLPSMALGLLSIAGVDEAVTIILSGLAFGVNIRIIRGAYSGWKLNPLSE